MAALTRALCTSAAVLGALGAGAAPGRWLLGSDAESCDKACSGRGGRCSEERWPESGEELRTIAKQLNYTCKEIQRGTIRYDPSAAGAYCGWQGEVLRSGLQGPRCGVSPPWSTRRFCFCMGAREAGAEEAGKGTAEGAEGEQTNLRSTRARDADGASRNAAAEASTTTLPFDCNEGFPNWHLGWSVAKKAWCCHHESLGCPTTTTAETSTTTLPFDCNEGFPNWHRGWSAAKKTWCCHHESLGCPTTTTATTTTSAPFDCDAGYSNYKSGWSQAKMAWCCKHEGRGCTTTTAAPTNAPYDCDAGRSNWKAGWSGNKKEWCCLHKDLGCPFDCNAGFSNWKQGWSDQKKEWCCQTKSRGCA